MSGITEDKLLFCAIILLKANSEEEKNIYQDSFLESKQTFEV